jgi:hypothetical protein
VGRSPRRAALEPRALGARRDADGLRQVHEGEPELLPLSPTLATLAPGVRVVRVEREELGERLDRVVPLLRRHEVVRELRERGAPIGHPRGEALGARSGPVRLPPRHAERRGERGDQEPHGDSPERHPATLPSSGLRNARRPGKLCRHETREESACIPVY